MVESGFILIHAFLSHSLHRHQWVGILSTSQSYKAGNLTPNFSGDSFHSAFEQYQRLMYLILTAWPRGVGSCSAWSHSAWPSIMCWMERVGGHPGHRQGKCFTSLVFWPLHSARVILLVKLCWHPPLLSKSFHGSHAFRIKSQPLKTRPDPCWPSVDSFLATFLFQHTSSCTHTYTTGIRHTGVRMNKCMYMLHAHTQFQSHSVFLCSSCIQAAWFWIQFCHLGKSLNFSVPHFSHQ